MARGAVRGAATAWLALIALQAVSTRQGSGRVAGAFTDVSRLIDRVLDPTVPAIPDRRTGATTNPHASSATRDTSATDPAFRTDGTGRVPIPGAPRPV